MPEQYPIRSRGRGHLPSSGPSDHHSHDPYGSLDFELDHMGENIATSDTSPIFGTDNRNKTRILSMAEPSKHPELRTVDTEKSDSIDSFGANAADRDDMRRLGKKQEFKVSTD